MHFESTDAGLPGRVTLQSLSIILAYPVFVRRNCEEKHASLLASSVLSLQQHFPALSIPLSRRLFGFVVFF